MTQSYYGSLLDTQYPAIRRVLREDYQRLDDEDLEYVIGDIFPGAEPDDVESFLRSLQKFGRQAAPIAQRALPGVIQGAVTGGMTAGPYGALAGAGLGAAGALLSPSTPAASPPVTAPTPPRPTVSPPATTPTAQPPSTRTTQRPTTPTPPAQAAPGNDALQRLLFLLSRPETARALSSLLVSHAGRPTQSVAGRQVPAMAFANAISELAGELVDSYAAYDEGEGEVSDYLFDEAGNARADLFNPAERAALLVADMASVAAGAETDDYVPEADWDDYDDNEWVDLAEAYATRADRGAHYGD